MSAQTITQERQERTATMAVRSSWGERILGLGGAVLAILGLSGVLSETLLPITALVLGVSLLFEGAAVTNRFLRYLEAASEKRIKIANLNGGASVESLAGLAGVTLAILALLNINPILVPIAAIVYGAAMMLGGSVTSSLNHQLLRVSGESEAFRFMAGRMMSASSNSEVLVGIGIVALGILAVIGINATVLTLIAFLAAGFMNFVKSATIGHRLSRHLHSHVS